jgi:hypothetical protein
MNIEK